VVLVAGLWIVSFLGSNIYAQSNGELRKMIDQMGKQIEAQQKQVQQLEIETGVKKAVETQPPMPAHANEWYIEGFVGGAFTLDTDVKSTGTPIFDNSTKIFPPSAKDVSLDSSPVVGAKGGLCPNFFLNLCVELEFDYFQPEIEEQVVRGRQRVETVASAEIREFVSPPRLDLSVWTLGLNAVGRIGFFPEAGYPLGRRFHLYLGAGPSFIWTKAEFKDRTFGQFFAGKKDTDFSVGVQALTGIKYFITKNLGVFAEYKFKHWDPHFEFSRSGSFPSVFAASIENPTQKINPSSLNANLFYVGLAFHF